MQRLGPLFFVALSLPSCFWFTTKHEADQIRDDVQDLKRRVGKQERSVDRKVQQLDDSLEKATKVLARNSADLGAEVERFSAELAILTGQIEQVKRELQAVRDESAQLRKDHSARLETLEHASPTTSGSAPQLPAAEVPSLEAARGKLQSGDFEGGRRDLRAFLQRFPQDERAPEAQYLIGESLVKEKQYESAIREFQRIIDNYPTSSMVDDAFFQAGSAAEVMRWCVDARAYFGVLVQKHPQSPFAKTARQRLDHLKKQAKNPAVCQG